MHAVLSETKVGDWEVVYFAVQMQSESIPKNEIGTLAFKN